MSLQQIDADYRGRGWIYLLHVHGPWFTAHRIELLGVPNKVSVHSILSPVKLLKVIRFSWITVGTLLDFFVSIIFTITRCGILNTYPKNSALWVIVNVRVVCSFFIGLYSIVSSLDFDICHGWICFGILKPLFSNDPWIENTVQNSIRIVYQQKKVQMRNIQWHQTVTCYALADLGGGAGTRAPPSGSNFLHFHAVFGKNWSNSMLAPPPLGLAPPRLGNPGSATVMVCVSQGNMDLTRLLRYLIVFSFGCTTYFFAGKNLNLRFSWHGGGEVMWN